MFLIRRLTASSRRGNPFDWDESLPFMEVGLGGGGGGGKRSGQRKRERKTDRQTDRHRILLWF